MQLPFEIPNSITQFIGNAPLIADEIGESPCHVYGFTRGNDRFFLKACTTVYAPTTYSVLREARVLEWLDDHLGVPEVAVVAENAEGEFMITRSVPGEPLRARSHDQRAVLELFREALRQLQGVPIAECPFDASASLRLNELEYLLARDLGEKEYDLQQWPNLSKPEELLARLHATLPSEESGFSHGDLFDNIVFVDAHGQLHFIDLGRGGIADRWLDIALVHRNLRENASQNVANEFLEGLGVPDQPGKREFFEQLDELF